MKLFTVIYFKGHLIAAMFLWQGATIQDCHNINNQYYEQVLPNSPGVKSHKIKVSDVRMACEWHSQNPVLPKVTIQ